MAPFGNAVGNEVGLAMGVNERESGRGQHAEGNFVGCAFDEIFDHVGEEFQLVDQMWKLRRIDLRELNFEQRQFLVNPSKDRWCDLRSPMSRKLRYLGHAGMFAEGRADDKRVVPVI